MDYGNLFSKAWDLVWKNKFLILLGMLVVIGGAGGGGGSQGASGQNGVDFQVPTQFDFSAPFQSLDLPVLPMIGVGILAVIAILIGLALWVIGTTSRGGLINGANTLSQGGSTNFSESFQAGWSKVMRLLGISVVPAVPVLLLVIIGLSSVGIYGGFRQVMTSGEIITAPRTGMFLPVGIVACILVPLALLLSLLRTFANRACMLEDLGVFASYRKGFEVLTANLGPAIVLFIIQVAISIGIWVVLLLPGILIALCCFLWPLLLLIQGTFAAWYSTLWTLAWNQWTGVPEVIE
jgi:hypothetical protein